MKIPLGALTKAVITLCAVGALICGCAIVCAAQTSQFSAKNYAKDFQALHKLTIESASKQSNPSVDMTAVLSRCISESEQVKAFSSIVEIRDTSNKELAKHDYVGISWTIDYARPDRYHVAQRSWSGGPNYDYDEWVALGAEHFNLAGPFWITSAPQMAKIQATLNRDLGLEKYVAVLTKLLSSQSTTYSYGNQSYLRLEFTVPTDWSFFGAEQPVQLTLWILTDSGHLAKTEASWKEKDHPSQFEQTFVGYGRDVRIEKPKQVMKSVTVVMEPPAAVFTHSTYHWSITYTVDWKIDSTDLGDVRIKSPAGDGLCGIRSGKVPFATVDEFADFMQAQNEQFFKDRGVVVQSSPIQRISLPNGVTGVDVLTDILSGGKSRRIYVLADGIGYGIDCETYAKNWDTLAPFFARIIGSFTLEKKP